MSLQRTIHREPRKWLRKKARAGARGYPVGTVAFYGPDDRRATKVVVTVIEREGGPVADLERWTVEAGDVRACNDILQAAIEFLKRHDARSVAMTDGIIGCPHEEGIDYPEGEPCPACPFWAGRDRWAGAAGHRGGR